MEGTSQLVRPVPDRVVNMGENRKGVVMRDQSRNLGQIRPDDLVWVSMSVQVRWFGESIRVREAVQGAQDPVEPSGAKYLPGCFGMPMRLPNLHAAHDPQIREPATTFFDRRQVPRSIEGWRSEQYFGGRRGGESLLAGDGMTGESPDRVIEVLSERDAPQTQLQRTRAGPLHRAMVRVP